SVYAHAPPPAPVIAASPLIPFLVASLLLFPSPSLSSPFPPSPPFLPPPPSPLPLPSSLFSFLPFFFFSLSSSLFLFPF
ncbi:hypothetical protein ACXWRW_11505, partial [Streptococcus pyogenes]